eukprot:4914592-Pleurochrysis_carterae.AAC.1
MSAVMTTTALSSASFAASVSVISITRPLRSRAEGAHTPMRLHACTCYHNERETHVPAPQSQQPSTQAQSTQPETSSKSYLHPPSSPFCAVVRVSPARLQPSASVYGSLQHPKLCSREVTRATAAASPAAQLQRQPQEQLLVCRELSIKRSASCVIPPPFHA